MNNIEKHIAYKISIKSMVINLFLFCFKGIFGLLISSISLISDSIHSLTDIFSTLIVLISIKISGKPEDESHPYGHEKIECIIAFLLGIMLFFIGIGIAWEGIRKVIYSDTQVTSSYIFNIFAIISAITSIILKEYMYQFTIKCAKKINSPSMIADAWHHRSDAFSSIGSLIGTIGLSIGYPKIDIIACLIISIFIFKAAYDICIDACKKMVDSSCNRDIIEEIIKIVKSNKEVLNIDALKSRQYGSKIYIDMEITLDKDITFEHSHEIAHLIHDKIEKQIVIVKHCMIHVNPSSAKNHHHI